MGTGGSKNIQEEIFKSENPRFSKAKVISENNFRYIQTKEQIQNAQYYTWRKSLSSPQHPLSKQFLLLPDKTTFHIDEGLCGNTGTVINNYPYYPYLLSQEIRGRQPDRKLFKQSDLWYLLYALIAAKHDISNSCTNLGDVKPQNVFINAQGQVKVANIYSWPNQQSSFDKLLDPQTQRVTSFVAPQDIALLSDGKITNDQNKQSQIFSIGATLLSAGILDDLSDVYDYKHWVFRGQIFTQKLSTWVSSPKYSQIFKSIILNLVDSFPDQRLTGEQLWAWISKYQQSIRDREQFLIAKAPQKIERQLGLLRSHKY